MAVLDDQPQHSPIVLVHLLKRIFSAPDAFRACNVDYGIHVTIEYLELLEKQRIRRINALEKRGGPVVAQYLKASSSMQARYNFALSGVKFWVHPYGI
jgi:hypothetical protein